MSSIMPAASNNSAAPFSAMDLAATDRRLPIRFRKWTGAGRRQRGGSAPRFVGELLEQCGRDGIASGSELLGRGGAERREAGSELRRLGANLRRRRSILGVARRGAKSVALGMKCLATGMAQFGGVDQLLARERLRQFAQGRIVGLSRDIGPERKGAFLMAHGNRERPVGRQQRRGVRLVLAREGFGQRRMDKGRVGRPVQRLLRQPFDAVDMAALFGGQPGEQFGDLALIDPAHAVGEHGVARRRLALHGVRDASISSTDFSAAGGGLPDHSSKSLHRPARFTGYAI